MGKELKWRFGYWTFVVHRGGFDEGGFDEGGFFSASDGEVTITKHGR